MTENEISKIIVDVAYKVHSKLGPGLLESVYEEILYFEFLKLGLKVQRQTVVPVIMGQYQNGIRLQSRSHS
jgi:GxxExxY protein